jgi:hypothetical protein
MLLFLRPNIGSKPDTRKGRQMLRRGFLAALIGVFSLVEFQQVDADHYVRGHYRKNGSYVRGHYKSDPDGNFWNNYSTYPNVNPYKGKIGTRRTPSYSSRYSTRYYSAPSYTPSYSNSYSWSDDWSSDSSSDWSDDWSSDWSDDGSSDWSW